MTIIVKPTGMDSTTGQFEIGDKIAGLENVDNTSDANKPISTAIQTALNTKQSTLLVGTTLQYIRGDETLGTSPVLATVATTGAYSDLTGKPTIPSAQVNSDWNASSGVAQVLNKPTRTFNNAPGRSIVTGTGAVGFQPSVTRDTFVAASMGIVTTASIGSGQDAYITMETASTNSATPSDWVEIGRIRNGQTYTLAVAVQGVQTIAGDIARIIPAGWYVKYRAVNVTGTPVASWISGQEVLLYK